MRSARIALCFLALVVAGVAYGQTPDADRPDPIRVPPDGQSLRIERVEDIPRQLKAAINGRCRPDDWLAMGWAIEIFRPANGYWPMALVPCGGVSPTHVAFVFDRRLQAEPSLMSFPVIAHGGGFSASEAAGVMKWDPAAKTLIATQRTDMGGSPIARHTYLHDGSQLNGFALVKVEHGKQGFDGGENWQTLWEARARELPQKR